MASVLPVSKPMEDSETLFVAIPAFQDSDALRQTIGSFNARTVGPRVVRPHVDRQSVVANKNILLEQARQSNAAYIAMSDDDVEPQQGWDQRLIRAMQRVSTQSRRRIGQVAPRMLLPDGRIFSLWANVHLDRDSAQSWVKPVKYAQPDDESYKTTLFVGAVPGTLSIFSRAALDAIGWRFDDRYLRSQYDDVDQSLECRRLGFEVLYAGESSIVHHTVQSTPRAASDNYEKLLHKWSAYPELSLSIEPGAADLSEASRYTRGESPTAAFRARKVIRGIRRKFLREIMP